MPPLTIELVAVIITGILVPLSAGVLFVWNVIGKKIKEAQSGIDTRLNSMDAERQRLLKERINEEKELSERIKRLEETTVSKDEHNANIAMMNKALDNITLALRETGATLTSRIDLVLFEVGRNRSGRTE